jgi:hypothetical protein
VITFRGDGYQLGVCSFNETSGGDLLEFYDLQCVGVTLVTWYTHARAVLFSILFC